jgi:hypothetical protein
MPSLGDEKPLSAISGLKKLESPGQPCQAILSRRDKSEELKRMLHRGTVARTAPPGKLLLRLLGDLLLRLLGDLLLGYLLGDFLCRFLRYLFLGHLASS